jgi:hypothetical protein
MFKIDYLKLFALYFIFLNQHQYFEENQYFIL